MALTCTQIAKAIATALRASTAIDTKCQTYFGRSPAVYRSASGSKGPESDIFPAFTVLFWGKEEGDDLPEKTWDLSIMLEVTEDDTEAGGDAENKDYVGADRLEELLDLAKGVVRGISDELFISRFDFTYEPVEFFPIFVGVLAFTVSYPAVMGGYEPTL